MNKMKSRILAVLMMFCFCSCEHGTYSLGVLVVRNDTGQDLYVDTNIKSLYSTNGDAFILSCDSIINERSVAGSKYYDESHCDYSIEQIVWNEDAFVRIYSIEATDTILLREWNYSKRNAPGKQLFNLSDSSIELSVIYHDRYGHVYIHNFLFPITLDDLEL